MRLFSLLTVLALVAAVAYGVEYAHGYDVDLPDLNGMKANLSDGFWGVVTHALDVLVDFIGKVMVKAAYAVLVVLHDLGFGGHGIGAK